MVTLVALLVFLICKIEEQKSYKIGGFLRVVNNFRQDKDNDGMILPFPDIFSCLLRGMLPGVSVCNVEYLITC